MGISLNKDNQSDRRWMRNEVVWDQRNEMREGKKYVLCYLKRYFDFIRLTTWNNIGHIEKKNELS